MALIQTQALNTLICTACRVPIAPKRKTDGGIVFPVELVHTAKTRCKRYASVIPAPAPPAPTREERRQARRAAAAARWAAECKAAREYEAQSRELCSAG